MSKVGINQVEVDVGLKVNVRQRKHVLYQITYELLRIFHAPEMSETTKVLYAGLVEEQAIDEIRLSFFNTKDELIFQLAMNFDWDLYEVLISTGRKNVEIDSQISSIEQFVGRKAAFEKIYETILSTDIIKLKKIGYKINRELKSKLIKKVGTFVPSNEHKRSGKNLKRIDCYPKEMEESKITVYVQTEIGERSFFKKLYNKIRGM